MRRLYTNGCMSFTEKGEPHRVPGGGLRGGAARARAHVTVARPRDDVTTSRAATTMTSHLYITVFHANLYCTNS